MANVKLTIDGRAVEAPAGTLLIEAARCAGIEIPSFCYYEGLALQAACRMCLVEVEKAPKLMTACTLPVAEGMVVRTESPQVVQARKGVLEFLLTNHPLDCPVCDKGGECELQDMVFRYGAGESRFAEQKQHVDERQWSPVVFYDKPRCILCFRCVRVCSEKMRRGSPRPAQPALVQGPGLGRPFAGGRPCRRVQVRQQMHKVQNADEPGR
jgi:NADH-quinone oxidoreductase subunit G